MFFLSTLRMHITVLTELGWLIPWREFNLPQKLIRLLEITIIEIFVKIKVESTRTDSILIKSGLRQGDLISPIPFNLSLGTVVRKIDI